MLILRDCCTGCAYCLLTCPVEAISSRDGRCSIEQDLCTSCGQCFWACPNGCIEDGEPPESKADYGASYDIVIIGAGIGGLMTAAALTGKGFKVAVFEQLGFIGGRYTEIEHKGYLVTTGAWTPPGPRSNIGRFLEKVGARINWITLRDTGGDLFHIRFSDGRHYRSLDEFLSRRELLAYARALAQGRRGAPSDVDAFSYVRNFVDNADLLATVDANIATASGLWASEVPASEFIHITLTMRELSQDFGYPAGGPRAIIQALAQVVEGNGGRIFTHAKVRRILIEDGSAVGVELDGGAVVKAGRVIHNGGVRRLLELVGPDNLPSHYLNRLRSLKGVECGAIILGTRERLYQGTPMLITPGFNRVVGMFEPTFFDPSVTPPQRYMYDVFFLVRSGDRSSELQLALDDLHKLFPHLDEVTELMVPMFFVGKWPGTETGQFIGQTGEERLDPRTPVDNLYLVGMDVKGSGVAGDLIPVGVEKLLENF